MSGVSKKTLPLHRFNKQRLFYNLKKREKMKKIAFMFVAAAMFAACGNTQKPAEQPVEENTEATVIELTAKDTTDAMAVLGLTEIAEGDTVAQKNLQVALDSILAAKMVAAGEAVAEVAKEVAPAEETPAQ